MNILNKAWIEKLAKQYDETNVKESLLENVILKSIHESGSLPSFLTKNLLTKIAEWKAPRTKGYVTKNEDQFVRDVTQVSLSTNNERLRIEVLRLLSGVDIRMASAILYFCFPGKYTTMDWRAWESLKILGKIDGEIEDTFECWQNYNKVCRVISEQNGVSLRKLDKALWQNKGGSL